MAALKQKQKRRGTAAAKAKGESMCGAKRKRGGVCTLAAGWGTSHPGVGKCKLHGGQTPTHVKAAAVEVYRTLLGKPKEINPYDAIIWCIKIRAGEVEWLSEQMATLQEKDWTEDTLVGKQFHLYARERSAAMKDLVGYSKIAVSLGIAERHIRVIEQYGEALARLLRGIMDDLAPFMNEEGRQLMPTIVRRHLILIEGGGEGITPPAATPAALKSGEIVDAA